MKMVRAIARGVDWPLLFVSLVLYTAGLVTMASFTGEGYFFERQVMWIVIALGVFFVASNIDWRFLRRTDVVMTLFGVSILILAALLLWGQATRGVQGWFIIGDFSFQPADPIKLVLIVLLAKYFSRRHIEIANFRHILVSGIYALIPFILIFLQPDLGSAMILFFIWLGMIVVSGVSKKHLALVFLVGIVAFLSLWTFAFADYQKARIMTFLHPYTELQGAGYNAYQSMVAVGSGGILGKGVGFGTQSRLEFLPEYQTDFIFAAFAEEWGLVGVTLLFALFGFMIFRILKSASRGAGNFETLFGVGVAVFLAGHFIIHVGMNVGLLPVTGLPLPFFSYGGSHLVTEFAALGMLVGMRRYSNLAHRDEYKKEIFGI